MRRVLALALLPLVASGCLASVQVEDGPTWFGFADGDLREREVGGGAQAIDWGWADYLAGSPPPSWRSGAFTADAWVRSATLQITYDLQGVLGTEAPLRPLSRPQLTAWVGTASGSIVSHEFADGPQAAAVASQTVTWEIPLPVGGLFVREGDALQVWVGTYYLHYDGVRLVGADSRLDVILEAAPAPGGQILSQADDLDVAGGACSVRDPTETVDDLLLDAAMTPRTITVPPEAGWYQVRAVAPYGDMDFLLIDPAGELVAHALGPGNDETILLGPDNLAGRAGDWTLVVYACSPLVGSVGVQWTFWTGQD